MRALLEGGQHALDHCNRTARALGVGTGFVVHARWFHPHPGRGRRDPDLGAAGSGATRRLAPARIQSGWARVPDGIRAHRRSCGADAPVDPRAHAPTCSRPGAAGRFELSKAKGPWPIFALSRDSSPEVVRDEVSGRDQGMHSLKIIRLPRPDQREDADLVLSLQAGDGSASEAIWDRYSDRVNRFLARSLGRSVNDVEDLTQEVF